MTHNEMLRISIDDLSRNVASVIERVSRTKERLVIERDGDELAMLTPVLHRGRSRSIRAKTTAEYEAARSAAGSWAEEDTDMLIAQVRASRAVPPRPRAEL